jgi:hypothetical protein
MTIQLPVLPLATTTTITLSSNSATQDPTFGGPSQRIARMGDRWMVKYDCRPLLYQQAAQVVADLNAGLSSKIRAYLPQPGINTALGAPAFASPSTAAGNTIAMTGFTPDVVIQSGQHFNITTGGVAYLYQVSAAVTADGSGNATVPIQPILKAQPATGDVINFANPVIEGFVQGNTQAVSLSLALTGSMSFTIREAQ